MSNVTIHKNDTVALEATLPRDLSGATVELLVGNDETTTATAVIDNASEGVVSVPLSAVAFETGRTEIKFRVTFADGTIEHLPPSGDEIYVYE